MGRSCSLTAEKIQDRSGVITQFAGDAQRLEEQEFDTAVVRELIANAMIHRDYDATGNVTVRLTPTALEIQNPGTFPEEYPWEYAIASERKDSIPINVDIVYFRDVI